MRVGCQSKDKVYLVYISFFCMYACMYSVYGLVSPENVGGVPSSLAEVDLISAVILVQGHLK